MPHKDSGKAAKGKSGGHDRWCDLWLVPRGDSLRGLVADLQDAIESNEARGRKRKGKDQVAFGAALDFLVADLASAAMCDPVDNPSGQSVSISAEN
jgi:hypothetical protein